MADNEQKEGITPAGLSANTRTVEADTPLNLSLPTSQNDIYKFTQAILANPGLVPTDLLKSVAAGALIVAEQRRREKNAETTRYIQRTTSYKITAELLDKIEAQSERIEKAANEFAEKETERVNTKTAQIQETIDSAQTKITELKSQVRFSSDPDQQTLTTAEDYLSDIEKEKDEYGAEKIALVYNVNENVLGISNVITDLAKSDDITQKDAEHLSIHQADIANGLETAAVYGDYSKLNQAIKDLRNIDLHIGDEHTQKLMNDIHGRADKLETDIKRIEEIYARLNDLTIESEALNSALGRSLSDPNQDLEEIRELLDNTDGNLNITPEQRLEIETLLQEHKTTLSSANTAVKDANELKAWLDEHTDFDRDLADVLDDTEKYAVFYQKYIQNAPDSVKDLLDNLSYYETAEYENSRGSFARQTLDETKSFKDIGSLHWFANGTLKTTQPGYNSSYREEPVLVKIEQDETLGFYRTDGSRVRDLREIDTLLDNMLHEGEKPANLHDTFGKYSKGDFDVKQSDITYAVIENTIAKVESGLQYNVEAEREIILEDNQRLQQEANPELSTEKETLTSTENDAVDPQSLLAFFNTAKDADEPLEQPPVEIAENDSLSCTFIARADETQPGACEVAEKGPLDHLRLSAFFGGKASGETPGADEKPANTLENTQS